MGTCEFRLYKLRTQMFWSMPPFTPSCCSGPFWVIQFLQNQLLSWEYQWSFLQCFGPLESIKQRCHVLLLLHLWDVVSKALECLTLTVILGYSSCYSFHGPHIVHLKEEFRLCISSSSAHNKMLQEVFTLHPLHTAVATSSPSTVPSALLWVSDQSATMPWRLTPNWNVECLLWTSSNILAKIIS